MTDKPSKPSPFNKVALIGLGLLGSSLCHAMRRHGLAKRIVASARTQATIDTGLRLGLIDEGHSSAREAVAGADLVILCVPVSACRKIAQEIAPSLLSGSIVTDVGSTKASVIADMAPFMPDDVHFIPGHPIAGTEHSGPESGFAELFDGRWCILTPPQHADPVAVDKLRAFWQACGSSVEVMEASHHDLVVAITSHLPHLIAYNIVGTAADLEDVRKAEVIKFSAGGFRDFTRIAASDPIMWRDVFLNNKQAVLEMLGRFNEDLSLLQRAIRDGDGDKLQKFFTRTRAIRRGIIDAHQDTDAPDFGRHNLPHDGAATPAQHEQNASAPDDGGDKR